MSLANKLGNIYTNLNTVLNDTNAALVEKGGNEVADISSIGDEIRRLETGGSDIVADIIDGSATEIEITGIERIRSYAFFLYSSLTNIIIGNGVTSIDTYAFGYCTGLTRITIPDSVTSISASVFYSCTGLTDIYLKPTTPPTLGSKSAIPLTTQVHVPIGSGNAYRNATNWSSYTIIEDIPVE